MRKRLAIISSLVAVGLAAWAFFLLTTESEISYDNGLKIECDSIAQAGTKSKGSLRDSNGGPISYDTTAGEVSSPSVEELRNGSGGRWDTTEGIERDCLNKRVGNTALMALLLAPASILGMLSLHLVLKRRRRYVILEPDGSGTPTLPSEGRRDVPSQGSHEPQN